MNKRAEAFLWYTYFGCRKEKLDTMPLKEVLIVCAKRAYLDMNRTLQFKDVDHKSFRECVQEKVVEWAEKLIVCTTKEDYDKTHKKACCGIEKAANNLGAYVRSSAEMAQYDNKICVADGARERLLVAYSD